MTLTLQDLGWSNRFAEEASEYPRLTPARVSEVHRDRATLLTESGEISVYSGAMTPAVGDWILVEDTSIARILTRKTELARRAAGTDARAQVVAANVDVLFVVSSCNDDFNEARLERYLAFAHGAGCYPVILLTKSDLTDTPRDYERRAEALGPAQSALAIDAHDPENIAKVAAWCPVGQTAALVGSSGVGKTTLANAMTGGSGATADIREDDAKGRHTTTSRSLRRMTNGGWLIDTPGMRALRLIDASDGISSTFADIEDLAGLCRFNDCAHESEPGCRVTAAIADGSLDAARLARWRKLRREDARNSEAVHEARARAKRFGRVVKEAMRVRSDKGGS